MANNAFSTKKSNFNEYLAQLEDLLRKNRGSGLYQGFDVNPNAQLLPGKVVNPTGLGQQVTRDNLQFDAYNPDSISFSAPNVGTMSGATPQPQGQVQGESTGQSMSAQDFFNRVGEATYSPSIIPSSKNYSGVGSKDIFPWASMPDGNVLWSDGYVRAAMPSYIGKGTSALSMGLFGRNQVVTQPYGNYNPIEPTPGNINRGTDFRTRDLQDNVLRNHFASPLRVVEIYSQAKPGSGSVGNRENRGYGNSILLATEDGSMIRVSHFDNLAPYKVGDVIQPGQEIGVPGSTGNVTGEHADVEVYNSQGQIVSPDEFIANVQETSTANKPLYKHEAGQEIPNASQPQQTQQTPQPQNETAIQTAIRQARDYAKEVVGMPKAVSQAVKPMSPERQLFGQDVNKFGLEHNIGSPEGFLGAGELAAGDVGAAGKEISQTIERANLTPRIDLGASELFRGDIAGAKQNLSNTLQRVGSRVGRLPAEIKNSIVPPAYADNNGERPETLGQNIQGAADSIKQYVGAKTEPIVQMGQGLVSKAKDAFGKITAPGVETPPSPMQQSPDSIQVGQVSGDQQITAQLPQKGGDNRDAFFKYGGLTDFSQYLKPNADQLEGGALSTSVFTPDFYKNPSAVGTVFGKTSQAGEATNLYKDYLKSNIKPGYDQPYREDIVTENGVTYKVLTPIKEYFENQYWQNQLANTPDKLTSDFSYQDYSVPPVANQANKGEVQTVPSENPFFKSGAASLFKTAGDKTAQFVQGIGNKLSDVYKANPFSKTVSLPEKLKQQVTEAPKVQYNVPEPTRQVISVNGSNQGQSQSSSQPSYSPGSEPKNYYSAPGSVSQGLAGSNKPLTTQIAGQTVPFDFGTRASSSAQISNPQPQSNPFQKILSTISSWFRR